MTPLKATWAESRLELASRLFRSHACADYAAPVEFAESEISFRRSVSSEHLRFRLDLTPYLADVLAAWEFTGRKREITVVAPEQTGKTLSWLLGLLWSFIHKPCLSLVVYQSDDKAEEVNADKMRPLMLEIPRLAVELEAPRSKRSDCYNFSTLKSYFMGAGSRVTSSSAKIRVADELDKWIEHEKNIANLQELRKRARSFSESLLVKVCTPAGDADSSPIWKEFLESSRGYWHLRCLGCGGLTLRSCDIKNLQFELDDAERLKPDTLRLACPVCKHEHVEADKAEMNLRGGYIHEAPELADLRPGFQWGALASQVADLSWAEIAKAQLKAGATADYQDQLLFDNSYRGLPYHIRRASDAREKALLKRAAPLPPPEGVLYRLMGCDTQDDRVYWIVRGFAANGDSWPLAMGQAMKWTDLEDCWKRQYHGNYCSLCMIDQGGHREKEVTAFVEGKRNWLMFKGDNRQATRWGRSKNVPKLYLAKEVQYRQELLYYLHSAEARKAGNWRINENPDPLYIQHLLDYKPDNKKKSGHKYENWVSTGEDHYFDCEKIVLVAYDVCRYVDAKNQQEKETRKCQEPREGENRPAANDPKTLPESRPPRIVAEGFKPQPRRR